MHAGVNPPHSRYVLIVEDDCAARDSVSELLRGEGYAAVCLQDGRQALDYLTAHPLPVLILLDGSMPVMTGWEFREVQKADPRLAGIPVIILSGDADLARRAAEAGVDAFIEKPLAPERLLAALRPFFA